MSPKQIAQVIAAGRVVFGLGMIAAPKLMRGWLDDAVDLPGGEVAIRAIGARDLVLGVLTLHTLDQPAGARMVATCGVADLVDVVATLLARDRLPGSAVAGTVAVGGGAALGSFATAGAMMRD